MMEQLETQTTVPNGLKRPRESDDEGERRVKHKAEEEKAFSNLVQVLPLPQQITPILEILRKSCSDHRDWSFLDSFSTEYEPKYHVKAFRTTKEFENEELIRELLEKLKIEERNDKLVILLKLLRIFSRLAGNRRYVETLSGIDPLLYIMRNHPEDVKIQGELCAVLLNLALQETIKFTIVKKDGIKLITSAMTNHMKDPYVQQRACGALKNLAIHDEIRTQIAKENGISCIIRALLSHADDAHVLMRGCSALQNLALTNGKNKTLIAKEGGVKIIIEMMRKFHSNPQVMDCACGALQNLAVDPQIGGQIVELDGIPMILQAMETNVRDADIQRRSCATLRNLARNESNQIKIVEAGGIQVICSIMSSYTKNTDIIRHCCGAFRNFSKNEQNHDLIVSLGAINLITEAMQNHSDSHRVLRYACGTVRYLARNEKLRTTLANSSCIQHLLDAIKKFPTNMKVLYFACPSIKVLADINDVNLLLNFFSGHSVMLLHQLKTSSHVLVQRCCNYVLTKLSKKAMEFLSIYIPEDPIAKLLMSLSIPYLIQLQKEKKYRHLFATYVQNGHLLLLLNQLKNGTENTSQAISSLQQLTSNLHKVKILTFSDHPMPTLEFASAINDPSISDVRFQVQGQIIYASKLLLYIRSKYFQKMLFNGMKETQQEIVQILDMSYATFLKLMEYLYTLQVSFASFDEAIELLIVGDKFQIIGLKKFCEIFLGNLLAIDNVLDLWRIGVTYDGMDLKAFCVRFFLSCLENVGKEGRLDSQNLECVWKMVELDGFKDALVQCLIDGNQDSKNRLNNPVSP